MLTWCQQPCLVRVKWEVFGPHLYTVAAITWWLKKSAINLCICIIMFNEAHSCWCRIASFPGSSLICIDTIIILTSILSLEFDSKFCIALNFEKLLQIGLMQIFTELISWIENSCFRTHLWQPWTKFPLQQCHIWLLASISKLFLQWWTNFV